MLFNQSRLQITSFSKKQTTLLKGLGILLIVLHNFFHNLTPVIGQNEFYFNNEIFRNFHQTLLNNPTDFIRALFSYFGHYGVQIFIFFSTYGLSKKYYRKPFQYLTFLSDRFNKIYLSFLLCIVVYIILGIAKSMLLSDEEVLHWYSLLWKILLISNFIPGQALMPVGPWWFLPFIFQVYVFFPLLLKGYEKLGRRFLLGLTALAIFAEWFINPLLISSKLNLNYMIFGHLPVLCLGIYLANQEKFAISRLSIVLILALFIDGNFNAYAWTFSGLTFMVLVLSLSSIAFNSRGFYQLLSPVIYFFGTISFHLFMVNGFLRTPFHMIAETYNTWWIDLLSALVSLLFSTTFAIILRKMDQKIRVIIVHAIN